MVNVFLHFSCKERIRLITSQSSIYANFAFHIFIQPKKWFRRPCEKCGEMENSVKRSSCKTCKAPFEKKKVEVKPVSEKQFSYHKTKLFQKVQYTVCF